MALNFSIFAIPLPIFLTALVLVVAAIVVLTIVEVRVRKRARAKKEMQETYYQRKLSATIALQSDPESFLISLDKVAREFFSEELGMQRTGKYSELIRGLNQKQKLAEQAFCQRMQEALYSGETLDQRHLLSLFDELKSFIARKEGRVVGGGKRHSQEPVQKTNQSPEEQKLNQTILKYMREGRRRGFTTEALKARLLSSGFKEMEIKEVIDCLDGSGKLSDEKKKLPHPTEKRILTRFSSSKEKDYHVIKEGVGEKDELGRAEIIEIVPYKSEEVPKKKVNYPEKEPESYKKIGSLDDLDRVKKKINDRKKGVIAD